MAKKVVKKVTKKKIVKKKSDKKKVVAKLKPVSKRTTCPECGSMNIIYSKITDRVICQDCAAIFAPLGPEDAGKFD